jgi:hypothetical protein
MFGMKGVCALSLLASAVVGQDGMEWVSDPTEAAADVRQLFQRLGQTSP